jgi:valyl-tRNA synthetase
MESMLDLEAERQRLQKEIAQAQTEIARLETRLSDQSFLTRAPAEVIEKERQKLHTASDKLARLNQQIF